MSDQATILARIREALRQPAEPRHLHGSSHGHAQATSPTAAQEESRFRQWLPPVGDTWRQRFSLFQANAAALKAELVTYRDDADLLAKLNAQALQENWRKAAVHRGTWIGATVDGFNLHKVTVDGGFDVKEMESSDVGITECDALVAQTGSVLVTSHSAGGRALSVLPPHHVVLARHDQLLPDLPAAFALLREKYQANWPSMMSFITGPSRTGDIERILVLGAHGPKRLTIYCSIPA